MSKKEIVVMNNIQMLKLCTSLSYVVSGLLGVIVYIIIDRVEKYREEKGNRYFLEKPFKFKYKGEEFNISAKERDDDHVRRTFVFIKGEKVAQFINVHDKRNVFYLRARSYEKEFDEYEITDILKHARKYARKAAKKQYHREILQYYGVTSKNRSFFNVSKKKGKEKIKKRSFFDVSKKKGETYDKK